MRDDLTVTSTASGGWAVRVPTDDRGGRLVYQWHADRALWCSGVDHVDDQAQPACTEPVDGLTEEPADADDARRIVAAWMEGQQ